jgi:PAS domain S-box-containing protein
MGAVMRGTDWCKTPLGTADKWSPALRMMVKFLLANRFPQLLWWGPQFCSLYNDAYVPILGAKHPWAIGQPVSEVWLEIWHILKPLIETPFHGGPATWMEDIPLEINRRGFVEETHFTIAYSPVPDETVASGIGGVLATVHEITEKVIGERRLVALRDLGARSVEPKTGEEACAIAAEALARHPQDVPFVLLYLLDPKREVARLAGGAGIDLSDRGCLQAIELASQAASDLWPISKALETEEIYAIPDLKGRFENAPQGPWSDPPSTAAVVPIRSNTPHQFAGFMIVGISSRLQFDDRYRNFLELMSTQIATTIANARAYEEERKRAEALAELDQAKTAFFSNVSHEFRTPLTLIMGPLEDAMAESGGLPTSIRENLELAHRNSLRLLKLVNALLDFSRIEARRNQASYEPTDLALLTAELASIFRSAIERAGMRLVIDCPSLPEKVYVDREMWEKIVLNLLSNAFKFTFEGAIEISVRLSNSAAELAVRDTGTGIPADEIPRLFERFHRIEGAPGRSYEGSGIGLALVQELVKLHGGSVRVESELGHGSCFIVAIPLGKAHLPVERIQAPRNLSSTALSAEAYVGEAERWSPTQFGAAVEAPISPKTPSVPAIPASAESARSKKLVLVADDNADMRDYLSRLLQDEYRVHAVCDGLQAIEAVRQLQPALVLTDVMMPRMDGFGVIRAIRSDPSLSITPVILVSARAGEESRVEGLEAGADDYLVKPFTARELLARVSSHVKMAILRKEALEAQRYLAAIVESSDDEIVSIDLNGIIVSCNKGAERLFGYKAEEMIGQPITLVIPPELHDDERMIRTKIGCGEKIHHFETVRLTKNGEKRDVSLTISPMKDATGRIVGVSRVARDISESKRSERALAEQARLLDLSNYAIIVRDSADRVTYWNRGAFQLYGYAREEAQGLVTHDLLQTEFPEPLEVIAARLRHENQWTGELTHTRKDGSRIVVLSRWALVRDHQGNPQGVLETNNDITRQKQIEQALRESEEQLRALADGLETQVRARTRELEQRNREALERTQQLRELWNRLVRTQDEERRHIARELHDSVGQYLAALSMVLEAAKNKGSDNRKLEEAAQITNSCIAEIRTLSHLLHPPLLEEAGLASAVDWYVKGFAARSGIQAKLEIAEPLGVLGKEIELVVFRVLQESLTNVHRHSGSKTVAIRIGVDSQRAWLEIEDQGKGMPNGSMRAGVGITGMRERIENLNGDLLITSNQNGTHVRVVLPLVSASRSTRQGTQSSPAAN